MTLYRMVSTCCGAMSRAARVGRAGWATYLRALWGSCTRGRRWQRQLTSASVTGRQKMLQPGRSISGRLWRHVQLRGPVAGPHLPEKSGQPRCAPWQRAPQARESVGCPLFGQGALDKCLQVAPWLAAACALALARAHKERHSFDSFLRPNSWTSKLRWSSCVSVYRRLCTCSRNSEVCLNGTALRRPRHRFSASDIMRPAICKISDRLEFSVGTIR